MGLADEYLENQVMTATPARLHLMVVDGAIRYAKLAVESLENDDIEGWHMALNRSRQFVCEIVGGLDSEVAPEIAENLKALFAFVLQKMMLADAERDPEMVRAALSVLEIHRETWLMLQEQLLKEKSPKSGGVNEPHVTSWTT